MRSKSTEAGNELRLEEVQKMRQTRGQKSTWQDGTEQKVPFMTISEILNHPLQQRGVGVGGCCLVVLLFNGDILPSTGRTCTLHQTQSIPDSISAQIDM